MNEPKLSDIYSKKELFKSLASGLIFGTLISLPFVLLAINLLLLYIYHVTMLSFLLLIVMSGWVTLIDLFYYKTLQIYRHEPLIDYKKRLIKESLISTSIIVIAGMFVVIYILPIYI